MTDTATPKAFVFMKVGNHAGEDFETILARKNLEFHRTGRIFWGYGGTVCHPLSQVQPFARTHERRFGKVYLFMETIDSRAEPELLEAVEYSEDGITWIPVPEGIKVIGSRYAFVLDEIKPGDLDIWTGEYEVGVGPSRGKRATEYLQGHVDKACLVRSATRRTSEQRRVNYRARLIEPYAVMLR